MRFVNMTMDHLICGQIAKGSGVNTLLGLVISFPYSVRLQGLERWYSVTKLGSGFLKSIGQFEKLIVA